MKELYRSEEDLITIIIIIRDVARLLVRYSDDAENLVRQLRKRSDKSSENEETDILYHRLIKKMPGITIHRRSYYSQYQ